jgi:hypothetical protein
VARCRNKLADVAPIKEIPRLQRFAARPALAQIFERCPNRATRNVRIREAHLDHGYTMTAIAGHLDLHLMTISRAVRGKC